MDSRRSIRQTRFKPKHMEHIVEPYRTTLLDVLRKNLKAGNRATYLHRLIYIASHSFPNYGRTHDVFQKCFNTVNENYTDERISGLLLYYPEYLCHVIESSEYSIHRFLAEIFESSEIKQYVSKMKLLAVYHNINQRLLEEWKCYSDKPPTLLEKIDVDVDRQTASRHTYNCIRKLYGLMMRLRPAEEEAATSFFDTKSLSVSFQNPIRIKLTDYLPEYSVLDFLLKTEHTDDLKKYLLGYGHVPESEAYQTMVWPSAPSYVPFNVFDSFQDPIEDLPARESIKLKDIEVPEPKKKDA